MYTIVLAAALTTGNATPGADIYQDIRDIKKEVEELRQGQRRLRDDELKLVIAGLRQKITDEKLDELRRDVLGLRYEGVIAGPRAIVGMGVRPLLLPQTGAASLEPIDQRTVISLQMPAGARLVVNDQDIAVRTATPTFITPPLEPGKDYSYDFKITVSEDGKTVTRTKRVTVRPGGVVRLNYEDMEAR
ncbi:MAG TPA: TIGR03000 domain-containing protein [Gemmataceae bacterium]|jgi:uncharacterized protein (TIGR03000 family)